MIQGLAGQSSRGWSADDPNGKWSDWADGNGGGAWNLGHFYLFLYLILQGKIDYHWFRLLGDYNHNIFVISIIFGIFGFLRFHGELIRSHSRIYFAE